MLVFFFQAEDGIRDLTVTGVQTCALPISARRFWLFHHAGFHRAAPASADHRSPFRAAGGLASPDGYGQRRWGGGAAPRQRRLPRGAMPASRVRGWAALRPWGFTTEARRSDEGHGALSRGGNPTRRSDVEYRRYRSGVDDLSHRGLSQRHRGPGSIRRHERRDAVRRHRHLDPHGERPGPSSGGHLAALVIAIAGRLPSTVGVATVGARTHRDCAAPRPDRKSVV